jgi:hypothetical protein
VEGEEIAEADNEDGDSSIKESQNLHPKIFFKKRKPETR